MPPASRTSSQGRMGDGRSTRHLDCGGGIFGIPGRSWRTWLAAYGFVLPALHPNGNYEFESHIGGKSAAWSEIASTPRLSAIRKSYKRGCQETFFPASRAARILSGIQPPARSTALRLIVVGPRTSSGTSGCNPQWVHARDRDDAVRFSKLTSVGDCQVATMVLSETRGL